MIPVLTPAEVKAIDAAAVARESLETIVARAGTAVAREAIDMLGGSYGRRVAVVAGPGLNGDDGRAAADRLRRHGVRVVVLDALELPESLPAVDLFVDAAFGIGLSRPWSAPDPSGTPVLAVDIPSGINGVTGFALGEPVHADRTVTMVGLKQGLLFGDGPRFSGEVVVADIGLDPGAPAAAVVEAADVSGLLPTRDRNSHKWKSALLVVAGSPGMTGAATLATSAAMRAGAGYVHLDTAAPEVPGLAVEVVASLGGRGPKVDPARYRAAVVGPGLSRSGAASELVLAVVGAMSGPVVVDGDGLSAIASHADLFVDRAGGAVLTPHDGEFETLTGGRPGPDRIGATRALAEARDAVVLLKGPSTVVADPGGRCLVVNEGDQRLATAGSGDVLAGIIGAFLAQGLDCFDAAVAAAFVHGRTARLGPEVGLVASDLVDLVPRAITHLRGKTSI